MSSITSKKMSRIGRFQRKRNFKHKRPITSAVKYSNVALSRPRRVGYFGFKPAIAGRLRFKTLTTTESYTWPSKKKILCAFTHYPNFFVKKRSAKSRMGKSVPKIAGRILRFYKNQVLFSIKLGNISKNYRWIRNFRRVYPSRLRMAVADKSAFKFTSALWACKYFRRYKKKVRRLRGRKVVPRGAAARQKKKIILRRFFHKKFDYLEFFGETTLEKLYGARTKALRSLRKKILSNGALQLLRHYGNLALTTPVSRKWGIRPRLRRSAPSGVGFTNMFNIGAGRNYRRLVIYIPEFQRIRAAAIKKLKRTVRRTGGYTPGLFQFFRSAHARDARLRSRRGG